MPGVLLAQGARRAEDLQVAEVVEGMQAAALADGGGAAAALRPGMFLHALDGESARTFGRRALRERLGRRYLQAHPYIQWPAASCARCSIILSMVDFLNIFSWSSAAFFLPSSSKCHKGSSSSGHKKLT